MKRLAFALAFVASVPVFGQNRIDTITPLAPELAPYGPDAIGVRTIQVTDKNRPDVLNIKEGGPIVRYDRTLTLEVWYPATVPAGTPPTDYVNVVTRDPSITATLHGRAVRDVAPLAKAGGYPLVIISHGYPGNRFLMSHLGENLASKGFVTVAIDHKDSTYEDQKAFGSTLYNRPFDQLFVLNEMARLGKSGSGSFLAGLVDANRTGIVGYSMGGYGVVNVVGGGYSKASESYNGAPPNHMMAERGAVNPDVAKADPRIQAVIAVAPWGMAGGFWDADGLKGIKTPVFFLAGSVDDVAGYEKGTRAIYEAAVNTDRYLLTFINGNHNSAAPIPAPVELMASKQASSASTGWYHYSDPVWDQVRANNIFDHFATAYFGLYLKGEQDKQAFLDVPVNGKDATWKGFRKGASVGLMLEHALPAK